jgi:hypothetical protein
LVLPIPLASEVARLARQIESQKKLHQAVDPKLQVNFSDPESFFHQGRRLFVVKRFKSATEESV